MASTGRHFHPWDKKNDSEQKALCHSKCHDKVLNGLSAAKNTLLLPKVWSILRELRVVDQADKNTIVVRILLIMYKKTRSEGQMFSAPC